ncbi:spermatogenesis-associated protein 7 isoform X2 [Hyperolius riggenbachi]|uniref:spermatogenesis-associated protein 7 isoform X2 n=1 Tax=Hyperolius riggenbachi TaxID=752182 RepID=UPI0035A3C0D1
MAGVQTGDPALKGPRVPSIPRCGVSSPFRGHMSTKSNAFCIGHSSRLSDQYRIRDHMMVHYNKILTAKAAVDCSAPKSMVKSIKYSDQQRREKMKKEVVRLERGGSRSRPPSRPHSRESLDSASLRKVMYEGYSHILRHSPYSDPGPLASPTSFISPHRHFQSPEPMADHSRRHPDLSTSPSRLGGCLSSSSICGTAARTFQDNRKKAYSGDLIEKHAHCFTDRQHPFILKTQAQSVLAKSRHYTPPRRKKRGAAREAEVQTEISSLRGKHRAEDGSPPMNGEQVDEADHFLLSEEEDDVDRLSPASERISPSPTMQRIQSEEEELAYLKFVGDVTSEILTLGLFSDRVLDRVFQRHLETNRHRLDEGKMRHLLDILRADLDSKDEKKIDLFDDHNWQSGRPTRDPLSFEDVVRTDGFHGQNFSSVRQNSERNRGDHSYLRARENDSWLKDDVLISLDTGEDNEASISLKGLDETYVVHHLKNNVLSSQEDTESTHQSLEAASSVPEDQSDASQPKGDSLPLSGDQEEVKLEPQEVVETSEKTSLDNALSEDFGENRRRFFPDAALTLSSLPEPAHASDTTNQLNDLEVLEKSFSDIIHVSKAEDEIDLEEKTENAASEQDNSDENDF